MSASNPNWKWSNFTANISEYINLIVAGSVTITTPVTTINGNVVVNGNVIITGSITAPNL